MVINFYRIMETIKTENGMIDFTKMIMASMKSGNKLATMTYKQIKSKIMEFKTAETKDGTRPVYDSLAERKLLETFQKELEKDIKVYESIGTEKAKDNAEESKQQLKIVTALLPKAATDDEIQEFVTDWIVRYGAISPKDMGTIINQISTWNPSARKQDVARIVKKNISTHIK